jgi:large subunit ribosomal protein L24
VGTTGILSVEIAQARRLLARQAGSLCHVHLMNRIKFHVKKGDNVEVISGNFRGSSGKILQVLPKKQRVLIEGVRIIKKHLRKSQDNPSGKIAEREGPIHISNVRLIEKAEKKDKKKETKTKKEKAKS